MHEWKLRMTQRDLSIVLILYSVCSMTFPAHGCKNLNTDYILSRSSLWKGFHTYSMMRSISWCNKKPTKPTVNPIRPIITHRSQSRRAGWRLIQFLFKLNENFNHEHNTDICFILRAQDLLYMHQKVRQTVHLLVVLTCWCAQSHLWLWNYSCKEIITNIT